MRGLILKDFYMIKNYCKSYLVIIMIFGLIYLYGDDNLLMLFYPFIISGMIPVTLLSYDERSKWNEYCGTLPYTKLQIVSAKYIIGLIVQLSVLIVLLSIYAVKMNIDGVFSFKAYMGVLSVIMAVSFVYSSITLPVMFKLGTEKGRIFYYFIIGIVFAVTGILSSNMFETKISTTLPVVSDFVMIIIAVIIYAFSWYLSVSFYKKREI